MNKSYDVRMIDIMPASNVEGLLFEVIEWDNKDDGHFKTFSEAKVFIEDFYRIGLKTAKALRVDSCIAANEL